MIFRLLENLLIATVDRWWKKPPKCGDCRTVMRWEASPQLFLLPVFHDDTYTPSEAYYLNHCQPITDTGAIPTGQRACRIWTLTCPACGKQRVLVEDFLRVRDTEVMEERNVYEYAAFTPLLNRTDAPRGPLPCRSERSSSGLDTRLWD